jgi:tRNA(fMet)-specific endonuclease VapC
MYLLDSDHLSILQRQRGPEFEALAKRCSDLKGEDFFVSIILFHEQFNGWIKYIAQAKDSASLVLGYTELEKVVDNFARAQVLGFGPAAAEIYDDLRKQRIRIGAMDLRIASIAIANQLTLLTKHTVDFERVPNLVFSDWTTQFKQ